MSLPRCLPRVLGGVLSTQERLWVCAGAEEVSFEASTVTTQPVAWLHSFISPGLPMAAHTKQAGILNFIYEEVMLGPLLEQRDTRHVAN